MRTADGGTLFLDELAELPPAAQVALLRVLQTHEVSPVGEARALVIDFRVMVATNRDLLADVESGRFRSDLFGRLRGLVPELHSSDESQSSSAAASESQPTTLGVLGAVELSRYARLTRCELASAQ